MTVDSAPAPDLLRACLLAAGRRVAGRTDRQRLTLAAICAEAGVSEKRFAALYPSLSAYQGELAAALIDDIRDTLTRVTANMPAGIARLKLAIETYLEANLAQPALRELLTALRFDPVGAAVIRRRVAGFIVMMELELRTAHWPQPSACARLLTAGVIEIAHAEHEADLRLPALRSTLFRYLDSPLP